MTQSKLQSKLITTACGMRYIGCRIKVTVARAKGISKGGSVWLESPAQKVRATAKVIQCIHP